MRREGLFRMKLYGAAVAAAAIAIAALPAGALINPNYTPVELVNQSRSILQIQLGPLDVAKGELAAKVVKALKGKAPQKLSLDAGELHEPLFDELKELLAKRKTVAALLFRGDFSGAREGEGCEGCDRPVGAVHLDAALAETRWLAVYPKAGGGLRLGADPLDLKAVWAGGNAMLARAARYVLADFRADVPAVAGVRWGASQRAGVVRGAVNGCMTAPIDPKGNPHLLVLANGGDRAFRAVAGGEKFADVTDALKLASRSRCAAWGDFNGDGRGDLASWDGKAVTLWLMSAGGTFQPRPVKADIRSCVALASLDVGAGRRAGLLISAAKPQLLAPDGRGGFACRTLPAGSPTARESLGKAGPCLVADFNADGIADVAQTLSKGLLLYAGKGAGRFAPPAAAGKLLGEGAGAVKVALCGDYDADGLLDVIVGGQRGCFLLANLGAGKFREVLDEAGEVEYNSKPNVLGAANCDLNNDGRQEMVLLYPMMSVQPFFNRGFRCFGFAVELDLPKTRLEGVKAIMQGQQAGCAADLNGDGTQELALVASSGDLWVLTTEAAGPARLGLTVSLPAGAAGPIHVTGHDGKRCLGARSVAAGSPGFFGKRSKGPILLEWKAPPGKARSRRVILLKPQRVELSAPGK